MEGDTVLFPAEVKPCKRTATYEVSFKPEISGVYGLALALEGGRQLRGSPFPVRAKTDETVAANCKMYGAGLTRAVAGQATSFTIQGLPQAHAVRLARTGGWSLNSTLWLIMVPCSARQVDMYDLLWMSL
jgi:hypothetical protein